MKQFEDVLICTDLDGTLLKNDKTVSEENLRAIRCFQENGGSFSFGNLQVLHRRFPTNFLNFVHFRYNAIFVGAFLCKRSKIQYLVFTT